MRFRARKKFRLGPFYVVITQSGRRSYGIKVGPFTHNFTRGTSTVNTPGPGAVYFGKPKARKRDAR